MYDYIRSFLGDKMLDYIQNIFGPKKKTYGNWSKTFYCQPEKFFEPKTVEEMKEILRLAMLNKKTVRCVGGGGSPSDLFCTQQYLVSMKQFNNIIEIDIDKKTIKVEAGASLGKINNALFAKGLALPVLPAVDFPTIGGILGTGVHGSGTTCKILPDYVIELELLTADGSILRCSMSENTDIFKSALVHLGALGVIISVVIQCTHAYKLKQTTTSMSFFDGLDTIEKTLVDCSDHGKFFYYPNLDQIVEFDIRKTNEDINVPAPSFLGQLVRKTGLLQLFFLLFLTIYKGLVPLCMKINHYFSFGKKFEFVDENFRVLHFDCLFSQHVSEWAIPQEKTCDFLRDLREGILSRNLTVHGPIEIRFVKASEAYLSQTYGRDSTLFNILMFRPFGFEPFDKEAYWELYETLSFEYDGRPHWAKVHKMDAKFFQHAYPKFKEFLSVREKLDPKRLFVNDYIQRHILE